MGLLSNFFNGKNPIDEKFTEIRILGSTMRQKEAQAQTRIMISNLMQNPSLINGMEMYGEFGNYLTNQLNNFQRTDEVQFITELAFFVISKRLNREVHPFNLFDRLIIMYNAEDFLIDTVKGANDLHYEPLSLSRFNSMHHIKWQAQDIILKMRYHDLFEENKFYRDGSNDNNFFGQEFIEISDMIENGKFAKKNINDIAKEGGELIKRCYESIASKYSFTI
jgi:hypothetical protein